MTCCATVFVQFFQRIIILLEENYEIKRFDFSTQKKLVILLYPVNLKIFQLIKELKGLEKISLSLPEQFTVKAHPALFEGRGRGEPKNEALLFQSRVDIHFQNVHKTLFQSTVCIHFQKTQKTDGSHSVRL